MNKLMGLFAFIVLVAFLAILVIHVPRLDLSAVIALTVLLAAWDLYTTHRARHMATHVSHVHAKLTSYVSVCAPCGSCKDPMPPEAR